MSARVDLSDARLDWNPRKRACEVTATEGPPVRRALGRQVAALSGRVVGVVSRCSSRSWWTTSVLWRW